MYCIIEQFEDTKAMIIVPVRMPMTYSALTTSSLVLINC